MKPRPRTAPASLALLAVLAVGGLAACGGDDADTGSAAESIGDTVHESGSVPLTKKELPRL